MHNENVDFDDKKIIAVINNNDKNALIELIMSKKDEYYRLAYIYMRNNEDALDALQDMIIKIYENMSKLRDYKVFETWSKTILVNTCKRMLKKKRRIIYLNNEKEDFTQSNEEFKKIDIDRAMEKLRPKQKEAVRLRYFMDMSYDSIAQITGVPIGTVKSRIFNGVKNLKKILGDDYCWIE